MTQIQEIDRIARKKDNKSIFKPFVKLPEQRFSSFSHLLGAILSVLVTVLLPISARGDSVGVFLSLIFGFSNIILFLSSAMTHSQRETEDAHGIWLKFDKMGIFLLIAGTYSVVSYYSLIGAWRIGIISAQWIFAGLGSILILFEIPTPRWVTASIYLIQGWMIIFGIKQVFTSLGGVNFALMLAAGLAYSLGTIFYTTKKPKLWPGKFGPHDLWHVCVLTGALLFVILVWRIV
jgi:hemolysin III